MPIINSLLDTDFYKFTMGQFVFNRYKDVRVKYAFKNRTTKVRLADTVNEDNLRRELDGMRTLRFNDSELAYLAGLKKGGRKIFRDEYLGFLKNFSLPDYSLAKNNGQYVLEFGGKWPEAIYWETPALAIINGLYYSALTNNPGCLQQAYFKGTKQLCDKVAILGSRPEIKFSDFGTRRRFSAIWQKKVVRLLSGALPNQMLGTSNVWLAKKYDLQLIGTMAHELFMAMSGIMHDSDDEIRASHNRVLQEWWDEYDSALSIALTDTYGSDFFFKDFTPEQAMKWQGLRQDSGDPIIFGEKAIAFYKLHNINPQDKLLVFSDGLDVNTIVKIADYFRGRINVSFGWGTNLTNDLGLLSLSLVIKAVKAEGNGLVKLSDNLAKATGKPEDVERFKRIFGYAVTADEECIY